MEAKQPLFRLQKEIALFLLLPLFCLSNAFSKDNQLAKTLEGLLSYEEKWEFYYTSEIEADSIEVMLREDIPTNERLELLLFYLSKEGLRDITHGEKEVNEALKIARNRGLLLQEAMALRHQAYSASLISGVDSGRHYTNQALRIADAINDQILEADIYTTLYFINKHGENHLEAIKYFIKSAALINRYGGHSIKNIKSLAVANIFLNNNNVSLANKTINKVDYGALSLNYKKLFMQAKVDILIKQNDSDSLKFYYDKMLHELASPETFQTIADGYLEKNNLDEALTLYHKVTGLKRPISTYSYKIYSKIAEIYKKKAVRDSAEFYLKASLEDAIGFKNTHDVPEAYNALATFYMEDNRYSKARVNAQKGYKIATANNFTESLAQTTGILSKILVVEQRYDKAYQYLQENKEYSEKLSKQEALELLQNTEINRELRMWSESEERRVAYEVEQKDEAISKLTAENQLRTLEAQQQRNLRISLIIGSLMLFALLLIIWNRYKIKKKALKKINEKNNENVLLMKEIHHRVKNNLQIVLSLLNVQSGTLKGNKELMDTFIESQNKIKAMAIIHQNLYNSNNFVSVSSKTYLNELVANIQNSYKDGGKKVSFNSNIENSQITMAMAVPLGLIVNELITNAYKYAFTSNDKENSITMNFSKAEKDNIYNLEINDNGQGLPENFVVDELSSFGIQLVNGLVQQLDGEMKIHSNHEEGTRFDISLKESQPT